MKTAHLMLAASALALMAPADDAGAAPAPAQTIAEVNPIATMEFPQFAEGTKFSLNMTEIPAAIRMDFLQAQARQYIANRLNSVGVRYRKDEKVIAWDAYDAASKADPLQTAVSKPEGERPTEPDYAAVYAKAVEDLKAGNVRKASEDGPKRRATQDPLTKTVTDAVVREVFDARKLDNPKYNFLQAKAEVGNDGIAYLNKLIDAKVEGGADKAALLKMLEERYIGPAKIMLGLTENKKLNGLPSIL